MKNLVVAYFCLSDLASRLNLPNLSGVIKHALALYEVPPFRNRIS